MRSLGVLAPLSLCLALGYATGRVPSDAAVEHRPEPPEAAAPRPAAPAATTLLVADVSAYHAELYPWRDEIVLVTPGGLTRLKGGSVKRHAAPLGATTTRHGDAIVFHRDGKLRALSIEDLGERELGPLERAPRFLFGSDDRVAWFEGASGTPFRLMTLSVGTPTSVLETDDEVVVATLHADIVYFVARSLDGSWRIGGAPLSGGPATFTQVREGRFPAMLAPGRDGIYFYDGPVRGVRRLGFDLKQEWPVAERIICSPLVVADRVVCAQVGGVFDVPRGGADPRRIAAEVGGPIARLTTSGGAAFWIADTGENRLTVRTVRFPAI